MSTILAVFDVITVFFGLLLLLLAVLFDVDGAPTGNRILGHPFRTVGAVLRTIVELGEMELAVVVDETPGEMVVVVGAGSTSGIAVDGLMFRLGMDPLGMTRAGRGGVDRDVVAEEGAARMTWLNRGMSLGGPLGPPPLNRFDV